MEGAEFDALVADIKAHGLVEAVVVYEDMVLDGRNRVRGCEAAGIEPTYIIYSGDDPASYVISANLHRRHLTREQKRELVAKLVKTQPEKSDRQIAKAAKTDHKTVGGRLAGRSKQVGILMSNPGPTPRAASSRRTRRTARTRTPPSARFPSLPPTRREVGRWKRSMITAGGGLAARAWAAKRRVRRIWDMRCTT